MSAPVNQFDQSFLELMDAKAAANGSGKRESVKLFEKSVQALVLAITYDPVLVPSGTAEAGGFMVYVRAADVPRLPEKFTPIKVQDEQLYVRQRRVINQVIYELEAGSIAVEDR
jgi:hypothetical protein